MCVFAAAALVGGVGVGIVGICVGVDGVGGVGFDGGRGRDGGGAVAVAVVVLVSAHKASITSCWNRLFDLINRQLFLVC